MHFLSYEQIKKNARTQWERANQRVDIECKSVSRFQLIIDYRRLSDALYMCIIFAVVVSAAAAAAAAAAWMVLFHSTPIS